MTIEIMLMSIISFFAFLELVIIAWLVRELNAVHKDYADRAMESNIVRLKQAQNIGAKISRATEKPEPEKDANDFRTKQ